MRFSNGFFGCLNPRYLDLPPFSDLYSFPVHSTREVVQILLLDKCTYFRLSMSICPLPLCLLPTSFTFRLIYPRLRIMCSFISAFHLSLIMYILEKKKKELSVSLSLALLHSHLKSPFLLGCAHRSMSLPIHRVVRKSHDHSRYVSCT